MIKKLIVGVVLVLNAAFFGVYKICSPKIVIVNHSSQYINEVIVKLPSNRIVFGAIAPKADSTIYYSWSQADGVYEYQILLTNGLIQDGKCGYITNHEIGKRLVLSVGSNLKVICNELS